MDSCLKEVLRISPREVIVDIDCAERAYIEQYVRTVLQLHISMSDVPHDLDTYLQRILDV